VLIYIMIVENIDSTAAEVFIEKSLFIKKNKE